MKKLLALLNTPARAVIAVGLIILIAEFLIMAVIASMHNIIFYDEVMEEIVAGIIDPILLVAIVSPTLYILIFRPMRNQQDELKISRRKIEQAHREWMAALDVIDDPIFLHDKQFRILRCNKAYQQRAGIPFPEIIGQPYYEIFPKTGAPLPCCLRALGKEEEAEEAEELAVGEANYRSRAFSIKDEQGVYLYSMHILEDITERKNAEDKLAENEQHFRAVTESANDAIITGAGAGNIVGWNAAAGRVFGYTEAEIIGQPLTVLMPERFRSPHSEGLARVVAGGVPHMIGKTVELAGLRKDGSEFPLEFSLAQWQADEGQFFTAIIRDITERKQAEAQLAEQLDDLRRWHDATIGREMRVLDLKHEVNELLGQSGQPPRYPSAERPSPE